MRSTRSGNRRGKSLDRYGMPLGRSCGQEIGDPLVAMGGLRQSSHGVSRQVATVFVHLEQSPRGLARMAVTTEGF